MLSFATWVSFYLKVFAEQYFVGWRFAYPTYRKLLSFLACLLSLASYFPRTAHLFPLSFILYLFLLVSCLYFSCKIPASFLQACLP